MNQNAWDSYYFFEGVSEGSLDTVAITLFVITVFVFAVSMYVKFRK